MLSLKDSFNFFKLRNMWSIKFVSLTSLGIEESLSYCLAGLRYSLFTYLTFVCFYAPAMIMAGALSVTPVRPSVPTHIFTYVCPNDICSLTRIFFIRILWNLVTLFSTIMSSTSSIMVHIAPGFQELWPFVYENSRLQLSNSNIFLSDFYETWSNCLVPKCLLQVR